jgi:hypothetical protein
MRWLCLVAALASAQDHVGAFGRIKRGGGLISVADSRATRSKAWW